MVTVSSRKRLESIEKHVLKSIFIGVLSKDDKWFKKTLDEKLPDLEEKAISLARKCKKSGECAEDDPLCDETRIKKLFDETRTKLKEEHATRSARTRFHH